MFPNTQYTAVTLCFFRDVPRGLHTSKSSMYRMRLYLSSSTEKKNIFLIVRSITKCLVLWIIFCISFTVPFLEKSYYLRLAPMIAILGHTGIYSPLFLSSMLFWFNNWNFFLHELSSLVWSSERPVCPQSCTYCTYYLCDSNIFHQIWDNSWIQITIVAFQGGLNHIS